MSLTQTPTWDVADIFADATFAERRQMVLDFITAHPERHCQGVWYAQYPESCGTIACIAGWTCVLAGDKLVPDESFETDTVTGPDGDIPVPERAAGLLGLTQAQADFIFYSIHDDAIPALRKLT